MRRLFIFAVLLLVCVVLVGSDVPKSFAKEGSVMPPPPLYRVEPEPVLYREVTFGNGRGMFIIKEDEFPILEPHLDVLAERLSEKYGKSDIGVYVAHLSRIAGHYTFSVSRSRGWHIGGGDDLLSAIANIKLE